MGVRGLTNYIARHAELFLSPFELHDCNLVIDGDNLACNLYKDVTGTYSAFGGDYDDFYRAVVRFFRVLEECNVRAYVLMDGGYEARKLRTVGQRLRGKIALIKRINPCGSIAVFPPLMKEVFVDALRDAGVPVMRCIFEADDELAALSRKLNCPVLSYDSDFYIHNVRYIPLVTLTVKAHTKVVKHRNAAAGAARQLRKNEVKCMEKRTKAHRVMSKIQVDNVDKRVAAGAGTGCRTYTYKWLDCCMYRIENLIARGALSKEKLPLFAALLGNDYIARSSFRNFFAVGMGKSGRSRKMQQQQRRIRLIMQWLRQETAESALERVMSRLRKDQRESLKAQVIAATSGYSNERCHSYDYFVANYENAFKEFMEPVSDDEAAAADEVELSVEETDDETDVEEDELCEEAQDLSDENDEQAATGSDDEELDENDLESSCEEAEEVGEEAQDKTKQFPSWFLEKLYAAQLPRCFVDLLHLRKYINSPQIEHFPYDDCNKLALPILIYNFTLLHAGADETTQPNAKLEQPEFTYLGRAKLFTNIQYTRYQKSALTPGCAFEPQAPNPQLLRHVFEMPGLDVELLFERISALPSDLQMYFLAVVYWLRRSQHSDMLHLHALLICVVVLRTIDAKIPAERDLKTFQKRFGKLIRKERQEREKDAGASTPRGLRPEIQALPVAERMQHVPKSDCYLVQDNLLRHFHMQELFKKKYDSYSTIVLHAFAELQAVVFQLHALNALLNFPHESPRMGQLYSGVFLYNCYDVLLRDRLDLRYYVQHFVFQDSQMMFDFYAYLADWCEPFVPLAKRQQFQQATQSVSKKVAKKKRQAERKKAAKASLEITEVAVGVEEGDPSIAEAEAAEELFDLNSAFCSMLKVR